jgi:hypothetical protein
MGEMADELLDNILDSEGCWYRERRPVCRHCGARNLWWYQVGDKWVLFERRPRGHTAPHRCNRGLTKADIVSQFDDIS